MRRKKTTSTVNMTPIKTILSDFDFDKDKYISREFQKFGYDLAVSLSDLKHKALYIKLTKENPRSLLLAALAFVKGASNVKSRARLFMWKLQQLKKEYEKDTKK